MAKVTGKLTHACYVDGKLRAEGDEVAVDEQLTVEFLGLMLEEIQAKAKGEAEAAAKAAKEAEAKAKAEAKKE